MLPDRLHQALMYLASMDKTPTQTTLSPDLCSQDSVSADTDEPESTSKPSNKDISSPTLSAQPTGLSNVADGDERTTSTLPFATHLEQRGPIVIQDVRGGTRDKTDSGQGIGIREGGPSYTLSVTEQHAVAFESRFVRNGRGAPDTIVPPLKAESGQTGKGDGCPLVAGDVGTPSDSNGMRDSAEFSKGMDSARYRALGNAVTVSVAEWIGRRIIEAERCEVTA
jgi:site-specific DNA-cytosine methylase